MSKLSKSRIAGLAAMLVILAPALVGASPQTMSQNSNVCDFSRVYYSTERGRVLQHEEMCEINDHDPSTSLTIPGEGTAVEIHFIGAPRWLNSVNAITDAVAFEIEILDLDKNWVSFGDGRPAEDGSALIEGDSFKARGLRFIPRGSEASIALSEIGGGFSQTDPDGRDDYEYFYNYVNDYYGTDDDITNCDNNVRGIYNNIPTYWDHWGYSSYSSSPTHFESESSGGDEDDYTDQSDLSFFCGHGTGSGAWRGWAYRSDTFYPQNAHDSWGERDLEWIASVACQAMHDDTHDEWGQAMNGIHLICGASTNMRQGNYGKKFAKRMVDSGAFDTAKKVKTSWFDTVEAKNPSGRQGIVLGENSNMGNDYLWGQGTVQSDPTDNSVYYRWRYNTSGWLAGEQEEEIATADRGARVFPAKSDRGWTVRIDPDLLTSGRETLPVFALVPAAIDSSFVRDIANAFCQTEGLLCGGDIGPGDQTEVNLFDGATELRVCDNSGSFHFERTDKWLKHHDTAPQLMMEGQAIERSEQLLNTLGLRPQHAEVMGVDYMTQSAVAVNTSGQGDEIPDSSFAIASRVIYRRRLQTGEGESLPVMGPGGSMSVALGDNGDLQRIFMGGWRPAVKTDDVPLIDIETLIERLTEQGGEATLDGVMMPVDSIDILGIEEGYFDTDCEDPINHMRPMRILHSTIHAEGSAPSSFDIVMRGEGLNPFPRIIAPQHGAHMPNGSVICFEAEIIDGEAPFLHHWEDEGGALLSNELSFCTEMWVRENGQDVPDSCRTLTLVVEDADGRVARCNISVILAATTSADDTGAPSAFVLSRNHPNPFNPTTMIRYEIPTQGGESNVRLAVYDVSGRMVRALVHEQQAPGRYEVEWNGRDDDGRSMPSGVYFYRIEAGRYRAGQKMMMIK